MKKILWLILFVNFNAHAFNSYVFISFSLPPLLLEQTLDDAARFNIPVVLNGLYENSMPKTIQKVSKLITKNPNLDLRIDPTLFEKFNIEMVPAIVVENRNSFDVLFGNLAIKDGLLELASNGECGLKEKDIRRLENEI